MIEYHPHPTDPTLLVVKVTKHYIAKHSDEDLKAAVLAEREACAKVCEDQIKSYMSKRYTTDPLGGYRERFASEQCAKAIRARGEK